MKNKSLLVQILSLTLSLAGIYTTFFGATGQAIVGVLCFTITAILQSPILSSGIWPKGWLASMWVFQVSAIVIQVANFAADSALIDPGAVNIFVMTVNAFLTVFIKDYSQTA